MEVVHTETELHPVEDIPVGQPFYVMGSECPDQIDTRWLNVRVEFQTGAYMVTGMDDVDGSAQSRYITVLDIYTCQLYRIDKTRNGVFVDAVVMVTREPNGERIAQCSNA